MNSPAVRDLIDCAVKVWSIFFFSEAMGRRGGNVWRKVVVLAAFCAFVLGQRYVLYRQTLSEAFVRNAALYLLTCLMMLSFRNGQKQYLVFLASIVFFLWGGWLKLFTPAVFASLRLPTFGYSAAETFPLLSVTVAENVCRVFAIVLMRRYAFEISPDRRITAREAFLAMVPAIIDHTTVLILYYLTTIAPSAQVSGISFEMTLLTLMLVFGMPCILAATEMLFRLKREELKLVRMEDQMRKQVREFESRRLSDENARRIYHDMSRHLGVLERMAQENEAGEDTDKYLREVLRAADTVTPLVHSGSAVLDTLLTQRQREGESEGIALECMVDCRGIGAVGYADLVTMFSNVVDNAYEAVRELPADRRRVTLSAGVIGRQWIVKCVNPYEGSLRKRRDGLFVTSKEDGQLHGIGLSNLRRIVESYGGVFSVDDSDGLFTAEWMIPVPVEG